MNKDLELKDVTYYSDLIYELKSLAGFKQQKNVEAETKILERHKGIVVEMEDGPLRYTERLSAFQHDLFEAILPVIYRYYDMDSNGDTSMISCYGILVELENYKDSMDEQIYAETILRKKFLRMLPKGYSKEDIIKMNTDGLIALDLHIQKCEYEDR